MAIFRFFQNGGWSPSWILLQVKNDVTARCGLSVSTALPNLVTISQTAAELLRFSVAEGRHLGFCWILFSDHPWSLPDDLKLCLKFLFMSIRFIRSKILRFDFSFQKFGLKCLSGPKKMFLGDFAPKHFGLSSRPQNTFPCAKPRILT